MWRAIAGVLCFAMTLATAQSNEKKTRTPPSPNTWQKNKECAAQAEKVMADKPACSNTWQNHYSRKYNRCFISDTTSVHGEGAGKDFPEYTNELIDAFERSVLAQWVSKTTKPVSPDGKLTPLSCHIDFQVVDCDQAARFVAEHLKN
jgi:hypothetical protein